MFNPLDMHKSSAGRQVLKPIPGPRSVRGVLLACATLKFCGTSQVLSNPEGEAGVS